jgi:beta-lactamase class A
MMLGNIDFPAPAFDASAALQAAMAAARIDPSHAAAALVVPVRDGVSRAGHRGAVDFYPASVAKLPLLVAAHAWQEQGRLAPGAELDRALAAMIRDSSNDATSHVVDCLTATTSGPALPPPALKRFLARRRAVNRFFRKAPWPALAGCNLTNKTWADGPYGRDRQALSEGPDGRNRLTADGVAELLWSIARHHAVTPARSAAMLALLERSLDPARRAAQPYNQVDGYLGAGLPPGSRLWSKAGRTSETRHDAATVRLPSGRCFVLVAFTEGREAAENDRSLPALAEAVAREVDR